MPGEFELEIIQRLTRIETKQDNADSKITQLFEFHNQNQAKIDKVDGVETGLADHRKGHDAWRIGISIPIITGFCLEMFNLLRHK